MCVLFPLLLFFLFLSPLFVCCDVFGLHAVWALSAAFFVAGKDDYRIKYDVLLKDHNELKEKVRLSPARGVLLAAVLSPLRPPHCLFPYSLLCPVCAQF